MISWDDLLFDVLGNGGHNGDPDHLTPDEVDEDTLLRIMGGLVPPMDEAPPDSFYWTLSH